MTHGLNSRSPRSLEEDERAYFREVKSRLQHEHEPQSALEDFCILQIAMCMVRFGRFWLAESSSFAALASGEREPLLTPDQLLRYRASLDKEMDTAIARLSTIQVKRRHAIAQAEQRDRMAKARARARPGS